MILPWKWVSTLLVTLLVLVSTCRASYYWDEENEHTVMSSGYFFKNGEFIYKIVLEKHDRRTWNEAETICQQEENGHLLTLGDPKEAAWVTQLLSNLTGEMGYLGRFWLGATDKRLRGVYEYIDGSPFRYKEAPWAKGEPNRPPKKQVKYQYCIVMDTKDRSPLWSDEDCFESFGYICKSNEAPRRLKAVQRFGYSWEWNYYDYKFVILPDDSMTWSEAEIYCQEAESGHLLSIYNSKESEWVTERIRQIRQVLGFQELWIGATDIFRRGDFQWTDQKPVNYTKWTNNGNATTRLRRKPREACVAILADPNWGSWSEEYCIKKLPFVCKTKKCQGKSDLAFIVDASGSVTESGFSKAKSFMFQVIRGFQVKNNQTHIGLIRFSDQADLIFGFKQHYGNLQLKRAIDNMEFPKGETETHKALELAQTSLFSQKGRSRDGVPKIALVMTDGKSRVSFKTALAAKKLKEEGVTIVTLGIGNGVDRKELISMASSVKDVLYVESYAALGAKVKDIRQRVCDEIIRVGLIQHKIREIGMIRQAEIDRKQRLEVENQRIIEAERRKKLFAEKKKKQEEAKKRQLEEAKKRQAQRNRDYQNRNRNTQNRNTQNRNRNTQNRNTQNRNRNTQRRRLQLERQRRLEAERKRKLEAERKRKLEEAKKRQLEAKKRQLEAERKRKLEEAKKRQQEEARKRQAQRNRNIQNRNRNTQNRNTQNRNTQNRNTQNRYNQNRNTQNRNTQNRNTQNRNTQNRYNQNRNTQNRNTQNRYNQNRNTQNRNTQNRYNQNRNTQNRNTQNRYNQRNRYNQNRNTQNRNNQRNRYNQNRNTQNRNNQNRNQRNRYQG